MDVQFHCVIKKGFGWRGKKEFFPYRVFNAVLVPISQGTIDCKKHGRSVRDITPRFLKSIFEAQSRRRQLSSSWLRVSPG